MGDQNVVLGIDAGGTKIGIGLVTKEGEILASVRYPHRNRGSREWVRELKEQIYGLLEKNKRKELTAIGVGIRGHVDFRRQRLIYSTVLELAPGFDLRGELEHEFGCPVFLDNDVKAAACGEQIFGAGKRYRSFVCYNVGTGIAAAAVEDGRLLRGKGNTAGEIGCDLLPGSRGEPLLLEKNASGWGIGRKAAGCLEDPLLANGWNAEKAVRAWKEGDEQAKKAVWEAAGLLAVSVVNMDHLLAPEAFVFVGGVVSEPQFFGLLREQIQKTSERTGKRWETAVEVSALGAGRAGMLGAAGVAFCQITG